MNRIVSIALLALAAAFGLATVSNAKPAARPFKDCPQCPQMVPLPAGSFMMGTSAEAEIKSGMPKPQAGHAEPIHQVTFAKGFAMAATPVTVAQFRAFVIYETAPGLSWQSPGFAQGDDYPVVCVSAEDGEAYAAWLSKKTGHKYAVPNESQYEYGARAGTTTAYFWGEERDAKACEYSNQPDLDQAIALKAPSGPEYRFQCHDGYAFTSPVAHYKPNPWGLYDMLGNIWEWTSDCWNDSYKDAPSDGSVTRTTGDCDARSSRGGSYGNAVFSSYVAIRAPRHATYVGHSWGFRVVRTD
jgi:formylglycine-generating enzyme required for sulfatase activity